MHLGNGGCQLASWRIFVAHFGSGLGYVLRAEQRGVVDATTLLFPWMPRGLSLVSIVTDHRVRQRIRRHHSASEYLAANFWHETLSTRNVVRQAAVNLKSGQVRELDTPARVVE